MPERYEYLTRRRSKVRSHSTKGFNPIDYFTLREIADTNISPQENIQNGRIKVSCKMFTRLDVAPAPISDVPGRKVLLLGAGFVTKPTVQILSDADVEVTVGLSRSETPSPIIY